MKEMQLAVEWSKFSPKKFEPLMLSMEAGWGWLCMFSAGKSWRQGTGGKALQPGCRDRLLDQHPGWFGVQLTLQASAPTGRFCSQCCSCHGLHAIWKMKFLPRAFPSCVRFLKVAPPPDLTLHAISYQWSPDPLVPDVHCHAKNVTSNSY